MVTDIQPCKLWTNEERMFGEKVFYLNKSTTKHLIVGLEPNNFKGLVKICDRVTGKHITIIRENFSTFIRVIDSILTTSYTLENGHVRKTGDNSGIKFGVISDGIWKLSEVDNPRASIFMHRTTFHALLRIDELVTRRLLFLESMGLEKFIEMLTAETIDLTEDQIIPYLYTKIDKFLVDSMEYQFIADFIVNVEAYSKVGKFARDFYRNSKINVYNFDK